MESEKQVETVQEVFARVFGAQRSEGSSPTPSSALVARPSPAVTHDVPNCNMSKADVQFAAEVVKVWLMMADSALNLVQLLVLVEAVKPELAKKGIADLDYIIARLPAGMPDVAAQYRRMRGVLEKIGPLPTEDKKKCLHLLNKILDCMEPLSPLVNTVARYAAKLQAADLNVEKMLDSIEDYQFVREVRAELTLMG